MSERYAVSPAVYVILERENVQTGMTETLFMRRSGTGYMDGHWGLPAGHLDPDESLVTGASRELHEEAGVRVEPSELDFVHVAHTAPRASSRARSRLRQRWRSGPMLPTAMPRAADTSW